MAASIRGGRPYLILLMLALLVSNVNCQGNLTLRIKNEMGPETDLEVHCHSFVAKADLGAHNVPFKSSYSFSVPERSVGRLDKTVYDCVFVALGYPATYVAVYTGSYYPATRCSCKRGQCPHWRVTPEGFFCGRKLAASWTF